MKAIVFGGAGFTGGAIVEELLRRGDKVWIADIRKPRWLNNVPFIFCDVRYREYFEDLPDVDEVYNCTGALGTSELFGKERFAIDVNIIGTLNTLDYARSLNARYFYPAKPNVWLNTYTITKKAAEDFCRMYRKEYFSKELHTGPDVRIMRWMNMYGPKQEITLYRKVVPYFIISALQNKDIEVYGTGNQTIDLIYSEDMAKIVVDFMRVPADMIDSIDTGNEGVFELGGHVLTVNEFAQKIIEMTGSSSKIVHVPMRRGEDLDTVISADTSALDLLMDWRRYITPLDEGLRKTIAWYKEHLNEVKI